MHTHTYMYSYTDIQIQRCACNNNFWKKRGYEFEGDQGSVYERVCKAEREWSNIVMAVQS